FKIGDRVFIISSTFGGTGVAGLPLILKSIRDSSLSISNSDLLRNSIVGAAIVLPYFGVSPSENVTVLDKASFISKTKAVLSYYDQNALVNISANAIYYIGDDLTCDYNSDPGQNGQRNNAHFIELVAALSVVNFMNLGDERLANQNGKPINSNIFEYGIKSDHHILNFTHLGKETQRLIAKALTQYILSVKFLNTELRKNIEKNQIFTSRQEPKLTMPFLQSAFFGHLMEFNKFFVDWLEEMRGNRRGFEPFRLESSLKDLIVGVSLKVGLFSKPSLDFYNLVESLNSAEKYINFISAEQKLIRLLYEATKNILSKKFDYFNELDR
ncbi:MAG TPA: hypothetical protein PLD02_07165, partial [Saprospiraceae bacterium]|nr:hypothetical protein [Saprospiraceae bacterium]